MTVFEWMMVFDLVVVVAGIAAVWAANTTLKSAAKLTRMYNVDAFLREQVLHSLIEELVKDVNRLKRTTVKKL